jgi:hypothetical protein
LVAQDNHEGFRSRIEVADARSIGRRATFTEDRILDYFGVTKVDAPANLIRSAAENHHDFIEAGGLLGLLDNPTKQRSPTKRRELFRLSETL